MSLLEKEKILIQNAIHKQIQEIDVLLSQLDAYQKTKFQANQTETFSSDEIIAYEQQELITRKGDLQKALFLLKQYSEKFGMCVDCGYPIPFAQLVYQPTFTRCMACQAEPDDA